MSEAKTRRAETDDSLPAAVTFGSAAIAARLRQAILDGKYADGDVLAVVEAIVGVFYTALVIARLVSLYGAQARASS